MRRKLISILRNVSLLFFLTLNAFAFGQNESKVKNNESKNIEEISAKDAILEITKIDFETSIRSEGQLKKDLINFTNRIHENPEFAHNYYMRALTRYKMQDYKGAISDLDKFVKIDSSNAKTFLKRGNIKAEIGNHKNAIKDFDKSISISPSYLAYQYRGFSEAELGNYSEAIKDFDNSA